MARPKTPVLTIAEIDEALGKYARLTDRQLCKLMDAGPEAIADLRQRGCKQNADQTWNLYIVYAHYCRRCRGRRVRKKPSKF